MSLNKINRFLVVGFGSIGKVHVKNLRELFPDAEIIVYTGQSIQDNGHERYVSSIDEALQHKPQAAIIANAASHHLKIARLLAKEGIALLIEKPLSSNLNGVDDLIVLCKQKGICLMIGYNLRFLPSLRRFHSSVLEEKVGKLLSVRAEVGQYLPSWRPDTDYWKTVSAKREYGGGVLLEISHEIDYLLWIFGDITDLTAVVKKQSDLIIDVEDTAYLTFIFNPDEEGYQLTGSLNMDFFRHDTVRKCTVIGSEGTLCWDGVAATVSFFDAKSKTWRQIYAEQSDMKATYKKEIGFFVQCVEKGEVTGPAATGEDGRKVIEIIEAARRSEKTGRMISFN